MADETSRARGSKTTARVRKTVKEGFDNVEFLDSSLADPRNILRLKLKQLDNMPAGCEVRRVMVVCDVITSEGRAIDVAWNETDEEPFYVVQDSILSMLSRVQTALSDTED